MAIRPARLRTKLKAAGRSWTPFVSVPITAQMIQEHPHLATCAYMYSNSRFQAEVFNCPSAIGGVAQLVIHRHGFIEKPSWEELQRCKNEIFGENATAFEVYPPANAEWRIDREVRILWVTPSSWPAPFSLTMPGAWGKGE